MRPWSWPFAADEKKRRAGLDMNGLRPAVALSIGDLVAAQADCAPETVAIFDVSRPPLTYEQLHAHCRATVLALRSLGIRRNDCVAIVLPNGAAMALTFLGVAAAASAAPLNPAYRTEEFEFYFDELNPKALIARSDVDSPAIAVARARRVPIFELSQKLELEPLTGEARARLRHVDLATPNDVALVLHTSGTTSRPKPVALTHANLCGSAFNVHTTLALTASDRCLNVMPLFHIHGLVGALLSSLAAGGSVVCAPGFASDSFYYCLEEFRPTWYTAVPTIHHAVVSSARARPDLERNCSLRLIRSCSAALPGKVRRDLEEIFNVPVIEAYGMTEASHQICSNPLPPAERKEGSVGMATGAEVNVVNALGDWLPRGRSGEIVVRGSNVIKQYAGSSGIGSESFSNGWFKTGDQGYIDDEGYLFITGRFKEIINRGGEKISPAEIDRVLLQHPAVKEATAFAVLHPTLGEEIGVAVVLEPQRAATEHELKAFVAARLADFKVPQRIVIMETIPKGATGKVIRSGLAEKLSAELKGNAVAPTTVIERMVAKIYVEVLGGQGVDDNDNFFDLGGDSLQAMQVLSRVRAAFQVNLPIATIFKKATVAELSAEIFEVAKARRLSPVGQEPKQWENGAEDDIQSDADFGAGCNPSSK